MRSIKDVERVIQETASSPRIPMKGAVIEAEMEDPHENRLEWVQGIITKVLPKNAGFKVSFKVENADERGVWEEKYQVPPNSTHLPPSPIHLPPSLRCPSFLFELHPSPHPLGLLFRTLSGCFFALSILLLLGWSVRTNRRMRIDISRGQWLCQLSEEGTEWRWPQLSIDEFKQSAQEAVEACRQVRVVLLWKKGFMTCSRAEWGRMISFKKVCESVQVV
jgi:hypothetical protein